MNIHEHQAKEILKEVPCTSFARCCDFILRGNQRKNKKIDIQNTFVLKAQIHSGGRGKAGGIKIVKGFKDLEKEATKMFGKILVTNQTGPEGKKSKKRIYIQEASDIEKDLYLSCLSR